MRCLETFVRGSLVSNILGCPQRLLQRRSSALMRCPLTLQLPTVPVMAEDVEARPAPFPASLPPWRVMQWLPLCEVAAALRVAWSWWLDS